MGDAAGAGRAIGDHWTLLLALGGSFAGVAMFVRFLMAAMDGRQRENMTLWISNGGGKLLTEKVKAGVLEALQEHQINCPIRDRVGSIEERLTTIERDAA